MKRTGLSFCFLVLILVALFASCGERKPTYVIGVSQCSDDEWRQKMNNEILTEALFYDNLKVEILSADDNNALQIEQIRKFIEKRVDLLVVAPNESVPITPVVEEAYNRGIPVIVVDRKILSDSYTSFIGADNYSIGKTVGEYVAGKLSGSGRVIQLAGLSGSSPAVDRSQGFMSVMHQYPDINVIASVDAAWHRNTAEQKTDSLLSLYPRVDWVFAHNDRMAYGAYISARKVGRDNSITFVGIDAVPGKENGVGLVSDNILDATFIYPTGGDRVVQTAMDILAGRPVSKNIMLSTAIVDKTNARVMELQTNEIMEQEKKIRLLNGKIENHLLRYSNLRLLSFAALFCLLVIVVLLAVVVRSLYSKSRLNRQLEARNDEVTRQKEQIESHRDQLIELSRKLEEATQAKLMFFTNISHDFRTPLTLISDPVEQLSKDANLTDEQRFNLRIIKKNTDVLLGLIDQILDFRKYENGKLELNLSRVDFAECINGWSNAFMPVIRKKYIKFSIDIDHLTDFAAIIDRNKIERCYFNILSNAFKFTPENGRIKVGLTKTTIDGKPFVSLSVFNSGSYISREDAANIFERFYQVDRSMTGSGIGLALTKAFVELHEGNVEMESDRQRGTLFRIELPTNLSAVTVADEKIAACFAADHYPDGHRNESLNSELPSAKEMILVIDDNEDIRAYIGKLLSPLYDVIEAADGKEGIRQAEKYLPDVILSDIMMPDMDGIECCRFLKNELNTSHIPIILLTACSLDEQRIEGLDSGADAYISKPFNSAVLLATIRSLLENRSKLRSFFRENLPVSKEVVGDLDKDFYDKFCRLIESRLDDPDLNIESIGRELDVNRVQLYRKIKALTSYSPNEFLRISRLKQAARLLTSTTMTVSEIGYRVGFSSPSYFTKCFREYFGSSPLDFARQIKK